MGPKDLLIEAFKDEDSLLRRGIACSPTGWRDLPGPGGRPSIKDILGHIAFWDDYAVSFFTRKLDFGSMTPPPPSDFEQMSHEARARFLGLPYGEVLGRYLEATGAIITLLTDRWDELSSRERHDFWTPLRHRRGHRIILETALERWVPDVDPAAFSAEG
jgi:hypothetical protein